MAKPNSFKMLRTLPDFNISFYLKIPPFSSCADRGLVLATKIVSTRLPLDEGKNTFLSALRRPWLKGVRCSMRI